MIKFYEDWRKRTEVKELLAKWVSDPEGLLTGNGYCEGIYEIKFVNEIQNMSVSAYIGQAGHNYTAPSYVAKDIYERLMQHLKRWLGGGYLTYWTGLDLEDHDWKIELHLLEEEQNHTNRLKKETEYIRLKRPFMQDTADGIFELYPTKFGYKRNDLCIHPWKRAGETEGQRRLAFLHRIEMSNKV